jgi:alpha-beta hydrolase superfamily lysophospholipase
VSDRLREDFTVTDSWGVDLFCHRFDSGGTPRAAVHLVHGLGEHLFRYQGLIDSLAEDGIEVWGHHQRGHGLTGQSQWGDDTSRWGRLGPGGHDAVVAGTRQITEVIRQRRPDIPLVFLGHSWGSLVGQILLNRGLADVVDGVILSGTTLRLPGYMNSGDLNRRHRHLGDTGAEWLSRDLAVQEEFARDPWTFEAKTLQLFGIRDSAKLLGVPRRITPDIPLLILVGSDDSLGGEKGARALAQSYRKRGGLTAVSVTVYPGARHEVFNETNRDEVYRDVRGWLAGLLPASTA